MLIIENVDSADPFFNLALEEHLLRHVVDREPILYFYRNTPSVILGRNQNVFEEVDMNSLRRRETALLRRLSGGGTVYHDLGNLNYSLISPGQDLLSNFTAFTAPVIRALGELSIAAELQGHSSIFVGDKKVSGNAQYASGGKLVSHGTLLFDSNLKELREAIRPRNQQVESRAIQSVRSSVTNLRQLDRDLTLGTLQHSLKLAFIGSNGSADYDLSKADIAQTQELIESRYRTWEWNVGRSPRSVIKRRTITPFGELALAITVEHGVIQSIAGSDGPPAPGFLDKVFRSLQGVPYDTRALAAVLNANNTQGFPTGFSAKLLLESIV